MKKLSDEDRHRLYRNVKLTLFDLDKIVQGLKDTRLRHFKAGDEQEVEYLNNLIEKIERFYEKESP